MQRTKGVSLPQNCILTNDPSFTAWGWAIVQNGKIIESGCIKTAPEAKMKRIRKGDDRTRRTSEIVHTLKDLISKYPIKLILSELPHGSQNAAAAVMIGIVTGVVQTISDVYGIALEWYSEADSKKYVLGKKAATKEEMIKAISKLYEVPWTNIGYKDEAVADAIAVYHVASKQSEVIKFLNS